MAILISGLEPIKPIPECSSLSTRAHCNAAAFFPMFVLIGIVKISGVSGGSGLTIPQNAVIRLGKCRDVRPDPVSPKPSFRHAFSQNLVAYWLKVSEPGLTPIRFYKNYQFRWVTPGANYNL